MQEKDLYLNMIYEYIENNILGEYTNAGRKNTAHTGQ